VLRPLGRRRWECLTRSALARGLLLFRLFGALDVGAILGGNSFAVARALENLPGLLEIDGSFRWLRLRLRVREWCEECESDGSNRDREDGASGARRTGG
jgi:hypothetical protein